MTDEEFAAKLQRIFVEEASQYLQRLQDGLGILEKGFGPGRNSRHLSLSVHNLRGAARTVGWDEMELLSHALEDVLEQWEMTGGVAQAPTVVGPIRGAIELLGALLYQEPEAAAKLPREIASLRSLPWSVAISLGGEPETV